MKFARRNRAEVDVNLTPLIDVVFLLLIFFMVSTTFTKDTQLSIDLPEASGDAARIAEKIVEVTVTRNGDYAVNEVSLVTNQLATLKRAIEKVSDGDTTIPMVITADSATPHRAVVTAMDAAGELVFVHLSIATRNVTDGEGYPPNGRANLWSSADVRDVLLGCVFAQYFWLYDLFSSERRIFTVNRLYRGFTRWSGSVSRY